MPTDVRKITESRRQKRENTQHDMRAALALEEISDTLEAMRADNIGLQVSLIRSLEGLAGAVRNKGGVG